MRGREQMTEGTSGHSSPIMWTIHLEVRAERGLCENVCQQLHITSVFPLLIPGPRLLSRNVKACVPCISSGGTPGKGPVLKTIGQGPFVSDITDEWPVVVSGRVWDRDRRCPDIVGWGALNTARHGVGGTPG